MEISKSISFITEDPRWQHKLLIGTGVLVAATVLSPILIGFLGFLIAIGYGVRLLQNVRDGQTYPMPEWDQWGDDLVRGVKLFVVGIVWAAPMFLLIIPSIIGAALSESDSDAAVTFGVMLSLCGGCLTAIYGLLLLFIMPGYTIAFAKDEHIRSGLSFGSIVTWTQQNIGQVAVVSLIFIAASFALSLLGGLIGVLLCIVGLIVTIPLATLLTYLIQYHLYGQLAYSFPMGGAATKPEPAAYTPPADTYPGMTPEASTPTTDIMTTDIVVTEPESTDIMTTDIASSEPGATTDTAATTDYPESGIDNPPPQPPAV